MKRTCPLLGVMGFLCASNAFAQPGSGPSEAHQILKKDVGDWDAKMKIYPQGPDGPAIESQGEEHNRVIGNGMWLLSNFEGKIGDVPFEGHGVFGYDPHKKKYTGTWVDNMKTTMDTMEGTFDAESQTMTMHSQTTDSAGMPTTMKSVSKIIDKNTRTFTMYNLAPGTKDEYVKMMEIHYSRHRFAKDEQRN